MTKTHCLRTFIVLVQFEGSGIIDLFAAGSWNFIPRRTKSKRLQSTVIDSCRHHQANLAGLAAVLKIVWFRRSGLFGIPVTRVAFLRRFHPFDTFNRSIMTNTTDFGSAQTDRHQLDWNWVADILNRRTRTIAICPLNALGTAVVDNFFECCLWFCYVKIEYQSVHSKK